MSLQQIQITSINVHKQNAHMQAILQTTTANILLIQEPWFQTVTTLQSDLDPEGVPQLGAPANNMWDIHVPALTPNTPCKALTYTRCSLKGIIRHITDHPATSPNTIIIDINNSNSIHTQIFNIYHAVPQQGHNLHNLFISELSDTTPTLLIGNFNMHSSHWSLPGKMPSSWAS